MQDSLNPYQQKYPPIHQMDKTHYIEAFKSFLFHSNDDEFVKNIANWVDLENVIDWHLILLFSNNGDGIMKNFYLYKIDEHTPFRFAIWDYDHSYGRDGDNELNMLKTTVNCNKAILFKRLSKIPEYESRLKKRWLALRAQQIISYENFAEHIRENDKRINREIKRNFDKWPLNEKWYHDDQGYEQELELMQSFVKIRISQLDTYFNEL